MNNKEKITLDISKNAALVLGRRYLKKDRAGNTIETPVEMFQRIASYIALVEKKYDGILKVG